MSTDIKDDHHHLVEDERFVDSEVDKDELEKIQAESDAKMMRHRLDDYVAIILGVGSCIILWILQAMGLY